MLNDFYFVNDTGFTVTSKNKFKFIYRYKEKIYNEDYQWFIFGEDDSEEIGCEIEYEMAVFDSNFQLHRYHMGKRVTDKSMIKKIKLRLL